VGERVAVPRALTYRDFSVGPVVRQRNFSVMARTLLMVENGCCIMCNFKELCVAKITHILTTSLLGALIALCLNGAVPAAGTCIEGPNLKAGKGGHWYYWVDRVNNRKCVGMWPTHK
jgi:hypothetical protein